MKLIKEDTAEEIDLKMRTYSLSKKLNSERTVQFYATIASSPEVEECVVDAFSDEIDAGGDLLRFPGSDPKTWLQRLAERNLTAEDATIRVANRTCELFFNRKGDLIIATSKDDDYPYEIIIEKALKDLQ